MEAVTRRRACGKSWKRIVMGYGRVGRWFEDAVKGVYRNGFGD